MKRNEILEQIGLEAAYMQLAEEASELSQAALKIARILNGRNPTPITIDEAEDMVFEEFTDVVHCAYILNLEVDTELMEHKNSRWWNRICENDEDDY